MVETRYVALLRAVNLGSTNKIAMPALRELATDLGFGEVATYINSGNLIFTGSGSASKLAAEITAAIADVFGHRIDVVVRTATALADVLAANPYPDGDPSQVTVAFLARACPPEAEEAVAAVATAAEPFTVAGTEIYVHYSAGIGRSKLAATFSAVIGVSATVRNVRTVAKLVELAGSSAG